jgi:hypothetical protein
MEISNVLKWVEIIKLFNEYIEQYSQYKYDCTDLTQTYKQLFKYHIDWGFTIWGLREYTLNSKNWIMILILN